MTPNRDRMREEDHERSRDVTGDMERSRRERKSRRGGDVVGDMERNRMRGRVGE
jgi:hypothetical protein